jgi:hypothetical protein
MDHPPYVAVCGGGDLDESGAAAAEAVGAELARRGALVLCGGLGGVMEAACRGARSEGGLSIGFLPGSDRGEANAFLDVALPTGLGERGIRSARPPGWWARLGANRAMLSGWHTWAT